MHKINVLGKARRWELPEESTVLCAKFSVQRTKKPPSWFYSHSNAFLASGVGFFFSEAKCQTRASVIFKIFLSRSPWGGLGIHLNTGFVFLELFQEHLWFHMKVILLM